MFIGHYALAFGAKKIAPTVSLGMLFLACQFADLMWPTLLLLGVEVVEIDPGNTVFTPLNFVSYPISHSLVMIVVWSAVVALTYKALRHAGATATRTVGLLVFSHFVLDLITHRPDLPLMIGGTMKVGLGLWNSPAWTVTVEVLLFAAGVWLYLQATTARDRVGSLGLWSLVAFLIVIYAGNLLGPPPPSVMAIAGAGHALWLFVAWAYWVDQHRTVILKT